MDHFAGLDVSVKETSVCSPERRESDLPQADHHFTAAMSSSFHVLSNSGF